MPGSDWAAVAKAMDRRLSELGLRQRDLAERAHVSQAIVRELQHNTKQRRRSTRTLEALSVALGWHPGHLHAVLDGREPPDPTAHVPPDGRRRGPLGRDRIAFADHRGTTD